MKKTLRLDGERHEVTLALHGAAFTVGAGTQQIAGERQWSGARLALTIAGQRHDAHVVRAAGGRLEVWIDSERHVVEEESRSSGGSGGGRDSDHVATPMPAKIVRVNIAAGDAVSEGQTLVVVESMKMELGLTAPRDGVVARVDAVAGVLVAAGAVLVALEPVS